MTTMPSGSSLVSFAAVSVALIIVPGPSVMFVVSRAVSGGRRSALLTVAGNAIGVFVQVVLVALGIGTLVERSATVFTSVKIIGAAYLTFLGFQAIRDRHQRSADTDQRSDTDLNSALRQGVVVGVSNPKSIVFFAAVLPQFVDTQGAAAPQMMVLGLVFVVLALILDSVWALVAGTARDWLASSPERMTRLGAFGGTVMIALGLQLALTGRRP